MGQVLDFNEKCPKHLAVRISKMLEGREYAVILETIGLLVGGACYSAGQIMTPENAENFRQDLLSTVEDHSVIQET